MNIPEQIPIIQVDKVETSKTEAGHTEIESKRDSKDNLKSAHSNPVSDSSTEKPTEGKNSKSKSKTSGKKGSRGSAIKSKNGSSKSTVHKSKIKDGITAAAGKNSSGRADVNMKRNSSMNSSSNSLHTVETSHTRTRTHIRHHDDSDKEQENDEDHGTPWAAIDTLDDVRKLALETKNETHFEDDFEKNLNKIRRNHINLLDMMRKRNQELEVRQDDIGESENDLLANTSHLSEVYPGQTIDDNLVEEEEPIYVSNYSEHLDKVVEITARENEYIEKMEAEIRSTRLHK